MKAPPTLLQLAGQSLLRNEALAISVLETLPMQLFPPLFMAAFSGRHTKIMKSMVQAWPFPCLPLGALVKTQELEILQVALDGVDMLLGQQVRSRRWKLQVMDLWSVHQNFWNMLSEAMAGGWATQAKSRNLVVDVPPRTGVKQPFRLIVDLNLDLCDMNEFQTYLFEWVQQRKSSIQLCCRKMKIWELSTYSSRVWSIHRVMSLLEPDWMEEVEMNCPLTLYTLALLAHYLGQMRNLRKLQIFVLACISPEQNDQFVATFASQLGKLSCLEELSMSMAYFLHSHLHQVLRCLKTPLESLSITYCQLAESDLKHLTQCQSINQLRHLSLRGVPLTYVHPELLQVLLEKVTETLKTLDLKDCEIRDPQLTAILPALSHCSQLSRINLFGNSISMSVLKDLLHHTARLSQLIQELYPAPLESYERLAAVGTWRFTQDCAELMDILRASRKPKMVLLRILMKPGDLETLQVTLGGIGMLLVNPRGV
ncbi:PRAME family member 12-like [Castor canadensis]|uniref:PRAME family member 12-like n=1 Tax=Castor canadensis TaxID=51338 RepID=A0AC58N2B2_CASCN